MDCFYVFFHRGAEQRVLIVAGGVSTGGADENDEAQLLL